MEDQGTQRTALKNSNPPPNHSCWVQCWVQLNQDVKSDMPVCDAKQTRCELEPALRRQMLYPAELRARGGYCNPIIDRVHLQVEASVPEFASAKLGVLRTVF